MNHNWDDMRFFLALCRKYTFVATAKDLHVTHTTVARRISALEDSLKTRLFDRTEKGCRLTPAGETLLPYAEKMESAIIGLKESVTGKDNLLSGTMRIGAPDGIGSYFLAPRFITLQNNHPALEVELIAQPMTLSLTKREVDISIAIRRSSVGNIIVRRLTKYKLGLFATKEYLEGRPEIRNREDLRDHRIIGYIDELLLDPVLGYLGEFLPGLTAKLKCSTVVAQRNAVLGNSGICVLPYFIAKTENRIVSVLPELSIEREYWLQVHPDLRNTARVRVSLDFITSEVESNRDLFMSFAGC